MLAATPVKPGIDADSNRQTEEIGMSGSPQVRRADKVMAEERARETLERGFCGRLATVGEVGWPYCVPLL